MQQQRNKKSMAVTETKIGLGLGLGLGLGGSNGNELLVVEFVKCECCGLSEECTDEYIKKVQNRFQNQWICGLCAEAVKNEECRIGGCKEAALNQHMFFCKNFKSQRQQQSIPTEELIPAVKHLIFRGLASHRSSSTPTTLDSESFAS